MTDHLVRRYGSLPVPRYTSYPTAAEFSAAVGSREHEAWLRRLDPRESVSVYLHVPYCRQLCLYCGCHTKVARRDEVIERYRATLEAEIATLARHLPDPLRIARLHWGGGTPSILGTEGLDSVLDALSRMFVFQPGFEHAIELDPRFVDRSLAQGLAALGVNRASLGVQDLDDVVQVAIGRVQPFDTVREAADLLRESGIGRINIDLMYGLPRQSLESIRATCRKVLSLDPDRIACYGYAHMPHRKANHRLIDPQALPGAEERFRQARAVAETFAGNGYVAIGLDHFARPDDPLALASRAGSLHRNFQGYTDDDRPTLVAFGASAISQLPDGYVQNAADIAAYLRSVEQGRLATARGYALTLDDRARGAIIESLMCNFAADLSILGEPSHYADELALLRPLVADGIVTVSGHRIAITEAGRPFVRLAAAVFDQFRAEDASRFSAAV
ncbi:oxygen-independent coproporphyrinogen III oxidase [Microvirga thermotolerans]|uniref:Coproporphyrinogen-III oxidase n=1 Tax=Microvirga thermotolerans TaxID=2651334 RepID=A0A5P9JVX8_9HYPH|nr:oxygen-independent coproporphyrinogen III oxidase [Microvirga thermotolerans]QFU15590.1 oxygen-independent coproporphyrinogen III oxidase [Microvirga thermotolerans]